MAGNFPVVRDESAGVAPVFRNIGDAKEGVLFLTPLVIERSENHFDGLHANDKSGLSIGGEARGVQIADHKKMIFLDEFFRVGAALVRANTEPFEVMNAAGNPKDQDRGNTTVDLAVVSTIKGVPVFEKPLAVVDEAIDQGHCLRPLPCQSRNGFEHLFPGFVIDLFQDKKLAGPVLVDLFLGAETDVKEIIGVINQVG